MTDAPRLWYEDVEVGDKSELGRYTFTRERIIAFARKYDPQGFHLDDEAARTGPFGALTASGWHTAAGFMRSWADTNERRRAEAEALGLPLPPVGPSPGFEKLEWLKPVFVDDTITYFGEVLAKRPLASRREWGLVTSRNTGVNRAGETAFSFIAKVLVARR
ncbi:MAG: MaoC family dehydratase [Parvibaculaceae bacterium]